MLLTADEVEDNHRDEGQHEQIEAGFTELEESKCVCHTLILSALISDRKTPAGNYHRRPGESSNF